MSGIIAVYALVIAVLIANDLDPTKAYSVFMGCMHLGAGLSVGLSGVAAGYAIGIVGDMVCIAPCKIIHGSFAYAGRVCDHTCSNRGCSSVWS